MSVLTPVPPDTDRAWVETHQRTYVFEGKPFRFAVGRFIFRIRQLTKLEWRQVIGDVTEIAESFNPELWYQRLKKFSEPDTKLTEDVCKVVGKEWLFDNMIPVSAMAGLMSELSAFSVWVKKNILSFDLNGNMSRDRTKRLTTSRNSEAQLPPEWTQAGIDLSTLGIY